MRRALTENLIENYMEKLFYFCLKKTGNGFEAEDLTQDIVLNVISAFEKGTVPENFPAYVWQIARNRYSAWAAKKHDTLASVAGSDAECEHIADEAPTAEQQLIKSEELSLLRRELAFISKDYRDVVLAFYIEDRKVRDIAKSLGLPEGTVKAKLFRARKLLKEGMSMAREFGPKSYNPQLVDFAASGTQPSGLPWRAVKRMIPNNILLAASNNPSTVEELSIELGIAVPYMEEEVKLLCDATLLKKIGDKFITDFYILSSECRHEVYNAQRRYSAERSELLSRIISDTLKDICATGIVYNNMSDNDLKWWYAIYSTDHIINALKGYDMRCPVKRANGETWGFIGYEDTELPERVSMGKNGNGSENAMFWAYKIGDCDMWDRVGEMGYRETLFLADVLKNKRKSASFTESETALWKNIEDRYAHTEADGTVVPDILIIDRSQKKQIHNILESHPLYGEITAKAQQVFDETAGILKKHGNSVLEEQLAYCASMVICNLRMMTVHDLILSGELLVPDDPRHSTCAMYMEIR